MGQILGLDNIPSFTVASTTSLTVATTNNGSPTRITVGGQQYVPATVLTLNTGTIGINGMDAGSLAANTLYYIYAVVSSNVLGLVISTNAVSPTGFTQYANIGRVRTFQGSAGLSTAATWLNGQPLPSSQSSAWQAWTPTLANFGTTSIQLAEYRIFDENIHGKIVFTVGTAVGSLASFSLPNLLTTSVGVSPAASTKVGDWIVNDASLNQTKGGAILAPTSSSNLLYFGNINAALSVAPTSALNGNSFNNGVKIEIEFICKIDQLINLTK